MFRALIGALFAAQMLLAPAALAGGEFGTKDEAAAMVKRVQELFKKEGAEATFKKVSDKSSPEFHYLDLYPYIFDMNGVNVAHGVRPELIGKNLFDMKDPDGTYPIREQIKIAKGPGSGWVSYKWPNPFTKKIEDKSSYAEKLGDYFVGVGVYKQ